MKVVIPRSQWLRGSGHGELWRKNDDCGCVLGHYGLALGYTKDQLRGCGDPSDVEIPLTDLGPKWPEWLMYELIDDDEGGIGVYETTRRAGDIISANDDMRDGWSDERRENELRIMFATHGIELEFV